MADPKRVYWDTCVWLALVNDEPGRADICRHIIAMAKVKQVEIWTSTFTLAEVFKKKCEGKGTALPDNKDLEFEQYVEQDFFVLAQVDYDIAVQARRLLRGYPALSKPPDGVHLATAVVHNLDELHTFDADNLLKLNGRINRADGVALTICEPPAPAQESLQLLPSSPMPLPADSATASEATPPQLAPATLPGQEITKATEVATPAAAQPVANDGVPGKADAVRSGDAQAGGHQAPAHGAKAADI